MARFVLLADFTLQIDGAPQTFERGRVFDDGTMDLRPLFNAGAELVAETTLLDTYVAKLNAQRARGQVPGVDPNTPLLPGVSRKVLSVDTSVVERAGAGRAVCLRGGVATHTDALDPFACAMLGVYDGTPGQIIATTETEPVTVRCVSTDPRPLPGDHLYLAPALAELSTGAGEFTPVLPRSATYLRDISQFDGDPEQNPVEAMICESSDGWPFVKARFLGAARVFPQIEPDVTFTGTEWDGFTSANLFALYGSVLGANSKKYMGVYAGRTLIFHLHTKRATQSSNAILCTNAGLTLGYYLGFAAGAYVQVGFLGAGGGTLNFGVQVTADHCVVAISFSADGSTMTGVLTQPNGTIAVASAPMGTVHDVDSTCTFRIGGWPTVGNAMTWAAEVNTFLIDRPLIGRELVDAAMAVAPYPAANRFKPVDGNAFERLTKDASLVWYHSGVNSTLLIGPTGAAILILTVEGVLSALTLSEVKLDVARYLFDGGPVSRDSRGRPRTSTLAQLLLTQPARSARIMLELANNDTFNFDEAGAEVVEDGTYLGRASFGDGQIPDGTSHGIWFDLQNPNADAAAHVLRVITSQRIAALRGSFSTQAVPSGGFATCGQDLISVVVDAGATFSRPAPANRFVHLGSNYESAHGTQDPGGCSQRNSLIEKLRALLGPTYGISAEVAELATLVGWYLAGGGDPLFADTSSTALRKAMRVLAAILVERGDEASPTTVRVFNHLGFLDYGFQGALGYPVVTPTNWGLMAGALSDEIHTMRPTWTVTEVGPTQQGSAWDSTVLNGFTLGQFTTAKAAVSTGRVWMRPMINPRTPVGLTYEAGTGGRVLDRAGQTTGANNFVAQL
ncbi:MAG: hypothetical protein PVSMB8_00020 [Vulcanimicrobiaceae bacterium]